MEQEDAVKEAKDYENTDSPVEKLMEEEELFKALLNTPDSVLDSMVAERRHNMFDPLWEQDIMPRHKALKKVRDMEEYAIDVWRKENPEYELPDWLVRMEAQHVVLKGMVDMLNKEPE